MVHEKQNRSRDHCDYRCEHYRFSEDDFHPVNGHLSREVPALEGSRYLQKVAGPKETAN